MPTFACLAALGFATGIAAAQEAFGPDIAENVSPGVDSSGRGLQQELAVVYTTAGSVHDVGCRCSACASGSSVYKPAPSETWFTRLKSSIDRKVRKCRRESYFYKQKHNKKLMYPDGSPYWTANWGYYQTCWRKFPPLCRECPPPVDVNHSVPAAPTPLPDGNGLTPAPAATLNVPPTPAPIPELSNAAESVSPNSGDVWMPTRIDAGFPIWFNSDSEEFESVTD